MNRPSSALGLVISMAALSSVLAQPIQATQTTSTKNIQTTTDAAFEERQARDWGLRSEDWTRYWQLMQGPLGVYSPNLDPLTALGIEARSNEERRRYAELQVQAEFRRTDKEMAYQRAFDAAWQRLRPGQSRITLPPQPA